MNLEKFREFEDFVKKEKIIWKQISLIEDIKNGKPKYGRKKRKISEVEFTYWDRVVFWLSNDWRGTNNDLVLVLATLLEKNLIEDKLTAWVFLSGYLTRLLKTWTNINIEALAFVSNLLRENFSNK